MDILGTDRDLPAPGARTARGGAARLRPVMVRRQRRRLLQLMTIGLGVLLGRPVLAGTSRRPLGPISAGQRTLITEFLLVHTQLLAGYVLSGAEGQADHASLDSLRRQGDGLMQRIKRELFTRIERDDMAQLEARWRTVADATRTRPTLDIARLMLPMAQEVAAPLGALLPPVDIKAAGGSEGRARRRLLMSQLLLDGVSACWSHDLTHWEQMDERRVMLEKWLNAVAQQGTGGVRLLAQWNLFASALPLRNAHCLPGAAHTLQSVGERLYKLL